MKALRLKRPCAFIRAGMVTMMTFAASVSMAQDYAVHNFKVIGSWTNAPHFKNSEQPLWEKILPESSGGNLTAQLTPIDALSLDGFAVGRMLKLGLFDFVHGGLTWAAGDNPVLEGVDLAGAIQNWTEARESVDAYRPILERALDQTFNAKLLAVYSEPTQVFYCSKPIEDISDLHGKKVRVYNRALSDLVEGLGGIPTSIDFAEVVTALQRGVVDCAVTGTLSGYTAKWYEVATHLYTLRAAQGSSLFLAASNATWDKLTPDARQLIEEQAKRFEDKAWAFAESADAQGINCNTGNGPCSFGTAQDMTLVTPSDTDLEKLKQVVEEYVLSGWASRCGDGCIAEWNETAGQVLGLVAAAKQ